MIPYYERNGIIIYCGDCLEIMSLLDPYYDAIIADLPYGTTACSWDSIIPLDELWIEYKRLIKDNGAIVLTGSQPFTSKLVMSNIDWFKYGWVWDKVTGKGHLVAKIRPLQQTEDIVIFGRKKIVYNPQMIKRDVSVNIAQGKKTEIMGNGQNAFIKHTSNSWYPKTLLKFPHSNNSPFHPTQKPVALMSYLIRTYTNSKEIILDNTMGSGTTLVAAQNEGRRATGIELSEDYCKIAVERLRQPSFFSIPDESKVEVKQSSFKDD